MSSDLARQGARGGGIMVAGQLAKLAIQVASVVILSRLLVPADFGLIAMTTVFLSLGSMIRDFGLPTAALQAQSLTAQQSSNLFWINVVLGLGGALVLVAATPLIVAMYEEPRLGAILPLMASTLVIGGLSAQSQVQLARMMRFRQLALAGVAAQLIGLLVSIAGALSGLGYWALAWSAVASSIALLALQGIAARWIPMLPRRAAGTKSIVGSGANFGVAQLLGFAAANADTVLIGARWDATEVGFYNRAYQLLMMPIQALLAPLTNVVMPIAHRANKAGRPIDDVLLRVQSALGVGVVWIFTAATSSAPFLIPLLVGRGWGGTVSIFQILAIGGAVQAFSFVSYWGFILYGQSRQLLYYNLVTKSLTVVAVALGSLISVEGVAVAYASSLVLSWPINLVWLAKTAGQQSLAYLGNGVRPLGAGTLAFFACWLLVHFGPFTLGGLSGSALTVAASTLVYFMGLAALPAGRRQLHEARIAVRLMLGCRG